MCTKGVGQGSVQLNGNTYRFTSGDKQAAGRPQASDRGALRIHPDGPRTEPTQRRPPSAAEIQRFKDELGPKLGALEQPLRLTVPTAPASSRAALRLDPGGTK